MTNHLKRTVNMYTAMKTLRPGDTFAFRLSRGEVHPAVGLPLVGPPDGKLETADNGTSELLPLSASDQQPQISRIARFSWGTS